MECRRLFLTFLLWSAWLVAAPLAAAELVSNPGFEAGTAPWQAVGAAVLGNHVEAHSGATSAIIHSRTAPEDGVQQSLVASVTSGETYAIEAWVRVLGPKPHPVSLAMLQVDVQGARVIPIQSRFAADGEWVRLGGSFTLNTVGALTELAVYVHGAPAGITIWLDDVSVATLADWEQTARSGAEQARKRDARIRVVDLLGNPVEGVVVEAEQIAHGFPFGSALADRIDIPEYADFFVENFEWATFENASKWHVNEPIQGTVSYATADALVAFCAANGIAMRGHNLFWSSVPPDWAYGLSTSALAAAVDARLLDATAHFEDHYAHWDVNNEMLHGDFFASRLGPEIRVAMYQQARALVPDATLFVNDYAVITGNETQDLKDQVSDLIAQGAPIDAVGAQSHFAGAVNPVSVQARLDSLAELGLPIWVTEFDVEDANDASHADQLETFYRVAFGHPAVEGILMWGFWAGEHWRGADAAIVNLDWSLRASGERYRALRDEWTTLAQGETDALGELVFRGFHGLYDVRIANLDGTNSLHRVELVPGAGVAAFELVAGYASVPSLGSVGIRVLALIAASIGGYRLARRRRLRR